MSGELTEQERILLLYLETCTVDRAGRVDGRRINAADIDRIQHWCAEGYVEYSRICAAGVTSEGSHAVVLSAAARPVT